MVFLRKLWIHATESSFATLMQNVATRLKVALNDSLRTEEKIVLLCQLDRNGLSQNGED